VKRTLRAGAPARGQGLLRGPSSAGARFKEIMERRQLDGRVSREKSAADRR